MTEPTLGSFLTKVRRRLLLIGAAAGSFWAVVVAAAVLLLGVWLDLIWDLAPLVRIGVLIAAAGAALACVSLIGIKIWRVSRTTRVARRLDQACAAGGLVVSGWELSWAGDTDRRVAAVPLTSGLATIAVGQATSLARQVPAARAVPTRPVRRAAVALAALVGLVLLLVTLLPSLARTEWQRFIRPTADIPPYSSITLDVQPGDTRVVYGDGLEIHAEVHGGPVQQVVLVYARDGAEESLPMFPEGANRWRATLAKIVAPATYYVAAGRGRSRRFRIDVITTPRIESVRFHVAPPAYTRDADYEGPMPQGGLAGLAGTNVTVWAKSNRPLACGTLQLNQNQEVQSITLAAPSAGGREVQGSFVIRQSGKFVLRVVDVAGQESRESFSGAVTLLADHRPFVQVVQPRPMSFATPEVKLPVVIAAEDDYGIADAQLFRSLNDSRPLPVDVHVDQPPSRVMHAQIDLPLSEYGLEPGDEIKLFARAEDNDPAGAKGAESNVVTVRIISPEDFQRLLARRQGLRMLMSKYQQARRRMETIAQQLDQMRKRLDKLPPDSQAAKESRAAMKQLAEQMRQAAAAIDESARQALPYDIDHALNDQLKKLSDQLRAAADSVQKLQANDALTNKQLARQLADLAKRIGAMGQQYEQNAMVPLQLLAKILPLKEDESRFVILVLKQRDLAERLASLKGKDRDPSPRLKARMRDLEQEQRSIREALDELLQDIEDHAAALPDDEQFAKLRDTARRFAAAVYDSSVLDVMADAETGLSEFSGTRGHENAKKAADILEQFLARCSGIGKACDSGLQLNFAPHLGQCLAKTVAQLLAEAGLNMGFGAGNGLGTGAGGGFSARMSTLNNVGLYGNRPTFGMEQQASAGRRSGRGAGAGGEAGGNEQQRMPSTDDLDIHNAATGISQEWIPIRYRRRVGQYFERILEETKDQ